MQNSIIFKILNENIKEDIPNIPKQSSNENIVTKFQLKDTIPLKGKVKQICELEKEELLIVNIYNQDIQKNQICIYKKIKEKQKEKIVLHFSVVEEEILCIKELKDGYLLIVKDNHFKINKISKSENSIKEIQNIKLENDEYFKDIIELINGNLISISYSKIDNSKNKIIIWNKNLMSGNYEIYKTINIKQKPISLLEINKNYFVVFCSENILYSYYSKSGEEYQKINIKSNSNFKKMIKVIEDGILFLYEKNLLLFCLSNLQIRNFELENITEIYNISNSNNYLATFSEQNYITIILLVIDLNKFEIYKNNDIIIKNAHSMIINCIFQLKNGNILTGSDDKKIKIWDTK